MSQGRSRCPLPPPAPQWTIQSEFVRARDGPERLARAYRLLLRDGLSKEWTDPPQPSEVISEGEAPCAPPFMPASRPNARSASRPSTANSTFCAPGRALPTMS